MTARRVNHQYAHATRIADQLESTVSSREGSCEIRHRWIMGLDWGDNRRAASKSQQWRMKCRVEVGESTGQVELVAAVVLLRRWRLADAVSRDPAQLRFRLMYTNGWWEYPGEANRKEAKNRQASLGRRSRRCWRFAKRADSRSSDQARSFDLPSFEERKVLSLLHFFLSSLSHHPAIRFATSPAMLSSRLPRVSRNVSRPSYLPFHRPYC